MKYTRVATDYGCPAGLRSFRLFLPCNCTLTSCSAARAQACCLGDQAGGLPEAIEASLGNTGKESSTQKLLWGHCCSNNRPLGASFTAATV